MINLNSSRGRSKALDDLRVAAGRESMSKPRGSEAASCRTELAELVFGPHCRAEVERLTWSRSTARRWQASIVDLEGRVLAAASGKTPELAEESLIERLRVDRKSVG